VSAARSTSAPAVARAGTVGTTREDTAAFAADGYARCRGIGALAVTYGVGALNVVNAIAGAYAESSHVVVISGAPGIAEHC
jgi:TPP-dependent 2-oxoacid decarboxylase